jgi:4,5-DOPA dioxygenase extradiol
VPLRYLYPEAGIPVVGISLPVPRDPDLLLKTGELLRPLRSEGIILLGSGGLVHNLARVNFREKYAPVDEWAGQFDGWTGTKISALDVASLKNYPAQITAKLAVPTTEHFDPVFPVLGARLPGDRAVTLFEGFHHANLSMRCFALAGGG